MQPSARSRTGGSARPAWDVVHVEDPGGGGQDYAHTRGLAGLALPEVHLTARPTDGSDPGADWRLSRRDLAGLLDDLATGLLTDRLRPGGHAVETMDGGLSVVRFSLGSPVPAADLGIELLPPDRPVLPVPWSLDRPPSVPVSGVPPGPARAAGQRYREVLADTSALRRALLDRDVRPPTVPQAWRAQTLPGEGPDLAPGHRFGPLHDLVLARAEQLLTGDAHVLVRYVRCLGLADLAGRGPGTSLPVLQTAARPAGRAAAVAEVAAAASGVVHSLLGSSGPTRRWREARRAWLAGFCAGHRRQLAAGLPLLVHDGVLALLTAEALADVVDPGTEAVATGPWRWALSDGTAPGPPWTAPGWAVAIVGHLLGGTDLADVARAGARLAAAGRDPEWREAHDRLLGLVVTSAATVAPGDAVLPAERLAALPGARAEAAVAVEVLLVSAVATGPELGPSAWRRLTAPLRAHLPHLPDRPPHPPPALRVGPVRPAAPGAATDRPPPPRRPA